MSVHPPLSAVSVNSVPKISCKKLETRVNFLNQRGVCSVHNFKQLVGDRKYRLTRLNAAGLSEIEPDLNEDPVDRWATNGVSSVSFRFISSYL